MAGSVSPTQMIAADGLLKNQGLGVSETLTSTVNSYKNLSLISSYGGMISALNGASVSLPSMPSFLSNLDNTNSSITSNITTRASQIAPNTKVLVTNLQSASSFSNESFGWYASIVNANTKSFSDYGLGITTYSNLAVGGLDTIFAGANIQQVSRPKIPVNFTSLAQVFRNFGTLFDPSDFTVMFKPSGLHRSLQKQGLGDVGNLNNKIKYNYNRNTDVTKYTQKSPATNKYIDTNNEQIIYEAMLTVTGSDLDKIIAQTGIIIPMYNLTSLADLLDAKNIVEESLLSSLPSGTLEGLGNALLNMGGKYNSTAEIAKLFDNLNYKEYTNLNSLATPFPASYYTTFVANLGVGTGPLGNPTVNDILGTVAGYAHVDNYNTIIAANAIIMSSSLGVALKSAADALAASPTNASLKTAFTSAQTALLSDSNLGNVLTQCNTAISNITTQLVNEINNCVLANIVLASPSVATNQQLLGLASQLHSMGADTNQLGYNYFLSNCATTGIYGDAIKASLNEGHHIEKTVDKGIVNMTKTNPSVVLKNVTG